MSLSSGYSFCNVCCGSARDAQSLWDRGRDRTSRRRTSSVLTRFTYTWRFDVKQGMVEPLLRSRALCARLEVEVKLG